VRWSAVPADTLAWREFEGEIVVRNARTASTHHLEGLSAEVLRALIEAGGPLTVGELAAHLGVEGDNADDQWRSAIQEVLREFERVGLAEPVTG
jgi:hypothetical protein